MRYATPVQCSLAHLLTLGKHRGPVGRFVIRMFVGIGVLATVLALKAWA
jgi:hypothetical protein